MPGGGTVRAVAGKNARLLANAFGLGVTRRRRILSHVTGRLRLLPLMTGRRRLLALVAGRGRFLALMTRRGRFLTLMTRRGWLLTLSKGGPSEDQQTKRSGGDEEFSKHIVLLVSKLVTRKLNCLLATQLTIAAPNQNRSK
jgi:hypothetical protein